MDYRAKTFKTKFTNAARHFGVKSGQVTSLKLRENVHSSDYGELLEILKCEARLHWQNLNEDFQGKGYLVSTSNSKVIIVEHETGLEILYITSSIASLIQLIPLIFQYWNRLRGSRHFSHPSDFRNIEIRRIDNNGNLQEHQSSMPFDTTFISLADAIDTELQRLQKEIKILTFRVKSLEKNNSKQIIHTKSKGKKSKIEKNSR